MGKIIYLPFCLLFMVAYNTVAQTPLEEMIHRDGIKLYNSVNIIGNRLHKNNKVVKFQFDNALIIEYVFTKKANDRDYIKVDGKIIYLNYKHTMPHFYSFIFDNRMYVALICYHIDDVFFHDESRYIYLIDVQTLKMSFIEKVNAGIGKFGDFNKDGILDYLNDFPVDSYSNEEFKNKVNNLIYKNVINCYHYEELRCLSKLNENNFSELLDKSREHYFIQYAIPSSYNDEICSEQLKIEIIDKHWF